MTLYGLYGRISRDFLTYGGRVLVHPSQAELEWLFPGAVVREVPPSFPADQCLPVAQHPDLASTTFPLDRSDFR